MKIALIYLFRSALYNVWTRIEFRVCCASGDGEVQVVACRVQLRVHRFTRYLATTTQHNRPAQLLSLCGNRSQTLPSLLEPLFHIASGSQLRKETKSSSIKTLYIPILLFISNPDPIFISMDSFENPSFESDSFEMESIDLATETENNSSTNFQTHDTYRSKDSSETESDSESEMQSLEVDSTRTARDNESELASDQEFQMDSDEEDPVDIATDDEMDMDSETDSQTQTNRKTYTSNPSLSVWSDHESQVESDMANSVEMATGSESGVVTDNEAALATEIETDTSSQAKSDEPQPQVTTTTSSTTLTQPLSSTIVSQTTISIPVLTNTISSTTTQPTVSTTANQTITAVAILTANTPNFFTFPAEIRRSVYHLLIDNVHINVDASADPTVVIYHPSDDPNGDRSYNHIFGPLLPNTNFLTISKRFLEEARVELWNLAKVRFERRWDFLTAFANRSLQVDPDMSNAMNRTPSFSMTPLDSTVFLHLSDLRLNLTEVSDFGGRVSSEVSHLLPWFPLQYTVNSCIQY